MKIKNDDYYESLSDTEVKSQLKLLYEYNDHLTSEEAKEKLKRIQRTRHILYWSDGSSLANSGHLSSIINIIYDSAIHYTREEYKIKTGKDVSVQRIIETPCLYILALCRSNDEQLAYTETRLQCVSELKTRLKTSEGCEITDKLRFSKADGPIIQFETGNQKGGNYFCPCRIHANDVSSLEHSLKCSYLSLEKRRQLVMAGPVGHSLSILKKVKPFEALTVKQLDEECLGHDILRKEFYKEDLQNLLTSELRGISRVPALSFLSPDMPLTATQLHKYEALIHEPMHDIAGHIDNILTELPYHTNDKINQTSNSNPAYHTKTLQHKSNRESSKRPIRTEVTKQEKKPAKSMQRPYSIKPRKQPITSEVAKTFKETIDLTFEGKEMKRCVDYRSSLLKVTHIMKAKLPDDIQMILKTLVEIQHLLYADDEKRTPRAILRLYNLTFTHAIFLNILLRTSLKSLTKQKFFGKYFHGIISHSAFQFRLLSGAAMNVEDEERIFNTIKSITNSTSSKHPGYITGNALIRMQVERKVKMHADDDQAQDQLKEVSRLYELMDKLPNSFFPFEIIKSFRKEWQLHLRKISDFLLCGEGIWWSKNEGGITFYDSKDEAVSREEGPPYTTIDHGLQRKKKSMWPIARNHVWRQTYHFQKFMMRLDSQMTNHHYRSQLHQEKVNICLIAL